VAPGSAKRAAFAALVAACAAIVSACGTAPTAAPRADGQARAQPRLIQESVAVQSVRDALVVRSVDGATRTVVAIDPQNQTETAYQVGIDVRLKQMEPGDDVLIRTVGTLALQVRGR
jgi:hypothetical protein